MSSKKLAKKVLITTLSASMVLPFGSAVYANTQALPNGMIITENGVEYLKDSNGEKYSGWFFDSNDEWYYFNETNKAMKKGWHHDDKDGYWYYLNPTSGKMETGWQKIDGKEYFFQPVRDMGNYHFNNEQEKWLYSMNSKVPYGAMYVSTTTPDGFKVDGSGAKVAEETAAQSGNTNASSGTQTTKNGWVSENGSWHYYENGAMAKDKWLNVSGKWYYVVSDGSMISNTWKEIGGKSYYFGADGAMYVNTTTPDGTKVDENGIKVSVKKNYSHYIGTFCTNEQYNRVMEHRSYYNNTIEKSAFDLDGRLNPGGYFVITNIQENHVTGWYLRHGDFDDSWSSFENVEINEDGTFNIYVDFEEQGNGVEVMEGLRDPMSDTFNVKCQLSVRNNVPVVVMNGDGSKNHDNGYDDFTLRKLMSTPLEQ